MATTVTLADLTTDYEHCLEVWEEHGCFIVDDLIESELLCATPSTPRSRACCQRGALRAASSAGGWQRARGAHRMPSEHGAAAWAHPPRWTGPPIFTPRCAPAAAQGMSPCRAHAECPQLDGHMSVIIFHPQQRLGPSKLTSTVQQLDLLRRLVADDGSSDAVEWLLEQVNGHSDSPPDKAPSAAPTEEEILAELPPSHLDHLLTEEERCLFERDGVRISLCHALTLHSGFLRVLTVGPQGPAVTATHALKSTGPACRYRSSSWYGRRYRSRWWRGCKASSRTWRLSTGPASTSRWTSVSISSTASPSPRGC